MRLAALLTARLTGTRRPPRVDVDRHLDVDGACAMHLVPWRRNGTTLTSGAASVRRVNMSLATSNPTPTHASMFAEIFE